MKRLRAQYPRTYPFAVGALGSAFGWGIGAAAGDWPDPWGLMIVAWFCIFGMVACGFELRSARQHLQALQMIQRAIATRDERLLEIAYLQLKFLESPSRRSVRRSKV